MGMRLERLEMVTRLAKERVRVCECLDLLARPYGSNQLGEASPLAVAIAGNVQGRDVVELVRPIIAGAIRAQLRQIDMDLLALGVEVA